MITGSRCVGGRHVGDASDVQHLRLVVGGRGAPSNGRGSDRRFCRELGSAAAVKAPVIGDTTATVSVAVMVSRAGAAFVRREGRLSPVVLSQERERFGADEDIGGRSLQAARPLKLSPTMGSPIPTAVNIFHLPRGVSPGGLVSVGPARRTDVKVRHEIALFGTLSSSSWPDR